MAKREEFLWVEKWRPKTIDECILPEALKKKFSDIIAKGNTPNFTFAGGAGTGKTTVARAIGSQLGYDLLFINASLEGNIDTLRTKIRSFASTVSLMGNRKLVLLDEADYLNPLSTQPALRGAIEEFSKNAAFIMTCNFLHKIIAPLHSRAPVIEFKFPKEERPKLSMAFLKRLMMILDSENIKYDKKVLAELVSRYFPDFRRVIGECQTYSLAGEIDSGILAQFADVKISELVKSMKTKDFTKMSSWVVDNCHDDPSRLYRTLYDGMEPSLVKNSIPEFVLILADYQYKAAFVADQEINLRACCTQLMAEMEWASK
jgi:DNA polymerase III delta prime subunit